MASEQGFDKYHARYAYEALILQQPHIDFGGLWVLGEIYYVVCESLVKKPLTQGGESLESWFDYSCRPVTCPVKLVSKQPGGSLRVVARTVLELSQLSGEPITLAELVREVFSVLPRDFPLVAIFDAPGKLIFKVERLISVQEEHVLHIALENLGVYLDVEVELVSAEDVLKLAGSRSGSGRSQDIDLISSKYIGSGVPLGLRLAYEEDEEFWVDNRVRVFSECESGASYLPDSFAQNTSSCFIDASAFVPGNIRRQLPYFRRVIMAMPLADELPSVLNGLKVTESELLELAARGRVQFALPQSVERYPSRFLAELLAVAPSSVLFSRRMAAASISESRRRFPLLYPTLGNFERYQLLRLLSRISEQMSLPVVSIIQKQLGASWVGMERNVSARGAMSCWSSGVSSIVGEIHQHYTGQDVKLELGFAGASVEWSAALGSMYCPIQVEGYSDAAAAQLCASFYSGVNGGSDDNIILDLGVLAGGLLAIDNDASVLEVDSIFSSSDIDRLGNLLKGHELGGGLQEYVSKLNREISKFESDQERLKRIDMLGLGGAVAGVLASSPYVPVVGWLLKYVLLDASPKDEGMVRAVEWLRAVNSLASPDAIMVSRLRNKLKDF